MYIIDRYAYANRIRTVDPGRKCGLALLVLLICLLLDRPAVGLVATGWMWGLATLWAGLPARVFGRVLLAEGVFLALAVLGVAVGLGLAPQPSAVWSWHVGPVWLTSSHTSVETALRLVTRALGGAAAMNLLALTTPLVDLVDLLRRLRAPALLIDLMTVMYRFVFTILGSLSRMYTAQDSRLGYVSLRRGLASAGLLGSRLFIDAYQRSQRLQTALESRGYAGDLRVLPIRYRHDNRFYWLSMGVVASLLLARVAL